MSNDSPRLQRPWRKKFSVAFSGVVEGVRGQSSFAVHFAIAAAVIVAGFAFGVSLIEWCLLILCITLVLSAEMLNSALEFLAVAITKEYDRYVKAALDVSSAAVLLASLGSVCIGLIIFINRIGLLLGWW